MRLIALAVGAGVLAAGGLAGGLKVTLSAPTHTPKVRTKWYYTVRATKGGKPAAARLTAQIVDPIGGVHAVAFGSGTKPITNYRFTGTFRDYIIWPADSRGVQLTLRLGVRVGTAKRTLTYAVTSHS